MSRLGSCGCTTRFSQVVYVLHTEQATQMGEAFQNMKLLARGSIRKKTNIIQTVTMMQRLMNHGLSDFTVFVRKWNAVAWFWLEPSRGPLPPGTAWLSQDARGGC